VYVDPFAKPVTVQGEVVDVQVAPETALPLLSYA